MGRKLLGNYTPSDRELQRQHSGYASMDGTWREHCMCTNA
jgi:hypothetical protein